MRGDAEWVPDNPVLGPAFVYRQGLLVGPQKLGKNPLIALQVALEGVGPALFAGRAASDEGYVCSEHGCGCGWEYPYDPDEPKGMPWPTPLIQITAFSEDQTANTYRALRPMIEGGPLAELIRYTGEKFMRLPGGGRIDTVTSSDQSRLGAPTTFVSEDQVEEWYRANRMDGLADTQHRNVAGMNGRAAMLANAWDPAQNSVAQRVFESKALDIYRQMIRPPKNLSYGNKVDRHKIHQIVYPLDTRREGGGHVDLASIEAQAADLMERDPAQAERYFGNGVVTGAGKAVETDRWDELARVPPFDAITVDGDTVYGPPRGTEIGAGFDGSIYWDDTSLRGCTRDGYGFKIGAWRRPRGRDMDQWIKEHPGQEWMVPRDEVKARVAWMRDFYRVGRFHPDPPRWLDEIGTWTADFGKDINGEPIVLIFDTNQSRRMAPAVDRWRTAIAQGKHTHDGDKEAARQIKNAHLKKVHLRDVDEADDTAYVIVKGPEKVPIDDAVADVLAHEAAMTMPAVATSKEILVAWR